MSLILEKCTILRWNSVLLLREVSETFERNRITHITGANGTGKTSLLRCIAGYYAPYCGNILLDGSLLSSDSVTYLGHDNGLKLNLTVNDNITSYLKILSRKASIDQKNIQNLMDVFRLKPLLDIPVSYLSHGQKRRVALALFFSKNCDIYLLDEPINGLDHEAIKSFYAFIDLFKKDKIILMTNHSAIDFKYDNILSLEKYRP